MMQYDSYIGKVIQLTYSDLDGERVCEIGSILYTLKNRAFVFETMSEGRQMIVYNRHVVEVREADLSSRSPEHAFAPDQFA
ncbi:hypothetical protein [Aneurinibacillus tyrosinisolvens]|jgi:hypothetical protein|uniref:hypothetical protein n=1 Tax=Aneurinibacillus tyrosinisolvens TaxID=1443435 RepID=UPI00063FBB21|nr:hypothetical protein [Aneurinibacillus tyrosinisolvens]